MNISIIRGPSLNPWDMALYEPLKNNHEVTAIGSGDISEEVLLPQKNCTCLGSMVSSIPLGISSLYRFFGDPQILLGLGKNISGSDIVHTAELRSYYTYQAVVAKQKKLVKCVTVTVFETLPFVTDELSPKRVAIKKEVIGQVDHFFAVTETAHQTLLLEGVAPEKITRVPHGVNCTRFSPKNNRQNKNVTILSIGRFVWEKGWWDLLTAAEILIKYQNLKNIHFKWVGAGPLYEKLEQAIKGKDLSNHITIEPFVPYKNIPRYYQSADIFALASIPTHTWTEQFGNVLVEAMASGLPIVTTHCGTNQEIVGNHNILAIPHNPFDLAAKFKKLINSPTLAKTIGAANRQMAITQYNVSTNVQIIENVWKTLLKKMS